MDELRLLFVFEIGPGWTVYLDFCYEALSEQLALQIVSYLPKALVEPDCWQGPVPRLQAPTIGHHCVTNR